MLLDRVEDKAMTRRYRVVVGDGTMGCAVGSGEWWWWGRMSLAGLVYVYVLCSAVPCSGAISQVAG
jgi:hypothetical protein